MGTDRPVIGVTMGDPCGVGAEIIIKALVDPDLRRQADYIIFGFSEQMSYTADRLDTDFVFFRDHHENIRAYNRQITVLDYDEFSVPATMPRGASKLGGAASMAFCEDAISAARRGLIDALVTAPISKTSWKLAGHHRFPGHTELLAKRCGAKNVAMMFVSPKLKVVLATIHQSLFDIRNSFTIGCVFNPMDLADQALRDWFGIENPRLGIAGLNPHAGEDGQFGDEEQRIISPAVLLANEAGINATGPLPADTIFLKALDGEFDAVVAMYHDQGLIPVKLLSWRDAVNLTLGLPIIRTSPDHGTAFDIAAKNQADPSSMKAAIRLAIELARTKARKQTST
ncbi:MAG: 4-hydroxythreonine-4-phosphate dehydrogenase PdxA [Phycisphaerae bacterium]|nr:4-hydroxythreonine-4-phosphate dehydrogenase PdxA [Phycisphaerae bacterium]